MKNKTGESCQLRLLFSEKISITQKRTKNTQNTFISNFDYFLRNVKNVNIKKKLFQYIAHSSQSKPKESCKFTKFLSQDPKPNLQTLFQQHFRQCWYIE